MPSEVILLALDGVPPATLFEPSIAARMPNMSALRAKGRSAPLASTIPAITVPAWASAMTSRDPGTLGVYGFRNRPDHSYAPLRVATSESITAPVRLVSDPVARARIAAAGRDTVVSRYSLQVQAPRLAAELRGIVR